MRCGRRRLVLDHPLLFLRVFLFQLLGLLLVPLLYLLLLSVAGVLLLQLLVFLILLLLQLLVFLFLLCGEIALLLLIFFVQVGISCVRRRRGVGSDLIGVNRKASSIIGRSGRRIVVRSRPGRGATVEFSRFGSSGDRRPAMVH